MKNEPNAAAMTTHAHPLSRPSCDLPTRSLSPPWERAVGSPSEGGSSEDSTRILGELLLVSVCCWDLEPDETSEMSSWCFSSVGIFFNLSRNSQHPENWSWVEENRSNDLASVSFKGDWLSSVNLVSMPSKQLENDSIDISVIPAVDLIEAGEYSWFTELVPLLSIFDSWEQFVYNFEANIFFNKIPSYFKYY